MSRPWRDGDIMIDPDGNQWVVGQSSVPHRVRMACIGDMINDRQDEHEDNGWRLKEESDE